LTFVSGTRGSLVSEGPDFRSQSVSLHTAKGVAFPVLEGAWFPDGFHGTMGELLTAIEAGREPTHNARNNLRSLSLAFAAIASAERQGPVAAGSVERLVDEAFGPP
jgi:hypothetical protein